MKTQLIRSPEPLKRLHKFLFVLSLAGVLSAEPAGPNPADDVVAKYRDALQKQQTFTRNLQADVTFEANIPKLKKQGKMNALRKISALGRVTYKVLGFSGDDTVKKEVIARYMAAEIDSASKPNQDVAITPENYNFKYKGVQDKDNRQVYVLELKPREKHVGLFKGELWLDRETYLPVREQGQFVKNPSVFIKKLNFVRNYEIRDGVAYLVHFEGRTDTRIVGRAELNADFSNYHVEAENQAVEEATSRAN